MAACLALFSIAQAQAQTSVPAEAPADAAVQSLPAVTVTGQAEQDGTTENTGTYQPGVSSTATKLKLTSRETPQTITTITRQQMDDAAMTSVDDAVKAASGVFFSDRGSNGGAYYSRGFELQTQFDGMAAPGGISAWNRAPQVDSAFIDRVEVLQGASGLLTGAGEPGGTINLVRKRPTNTFQAQAEVQLGSWNGRRVVGDISSPLTKSGSVRGRLVAVADNSDSFVDYIFRNRRAIYGIVEADLTSSTLLSASVQYQADKGRNYFGAPFASDGSDAGTPRSAFYNDANQSVDKSYTIYTLGVTQQLQNNWELKATYSRQQTENEINNYSYLSGRLNAATGGGMNLNRMRRFDRDTSTDAVDVYASGPFHLAGRKHELAVGMNGSIYRDKYSGSGYPPATAIDNIYEFNPGALGSVAAGGTPYEGNDKTTSLGIYGVARWSLTDDLKLITGLRVSNFQVRDTLTGNVAPKETGVITPYAGLIYNINQQYSVYASYSDIFNPQTSKSADGSVLKPVVGANYEVGIKGELLNKTLNVSAALFRLEQSNLGVEDTSVDPDPANICGGTCYTSAGKVISQGVDLGVNGQVGRNLNLAAGYTYTTARYASGPENGTRYATDQPRHSLRISADYRLPGTNWAFGGQVAATSSAYKTGGSGPTAWTIRNSAMVLVGLNARYNITPKTQVSLVVSNLTDRRYRHLEGVNYSTFGEPRKFMVNLRHMF
ncbi:TonB-dependent siderophore receptor [Ottowia sp. VDI28]|uniref:TonB-dependent siderophore receptor n=1 Tax=Ottowia sp. VDI28 TaxID=3133968 RepID=UPI003C2F1E8C